MPGGHSTEIRADLDYAEDEIEGYAGTG